MVEVGIALCEVTCIHIRANGHLHRKVITSCPEPVSSEAYRNHHHTEAVVHSDHAPTATQNDVVYALL